MLYCCPLVRCDLGPDPTLSSPVHALSPGEAARVQDLLLSGYWAFESLTVRDYNDMICGVCGVAPKVEVAQRFSHNVLELHNVQVGGAWNPRATDPPLSGRLKRLVSSQTG